MKVIKVITIGDSGVGKSSIISNYVDNKFDPNFLSTIGIDIKAKMINKDTKLHILDTAGQEKFRSITTSYYRNADGVLLVYDITDRQSFKNISSWIKSIDKYCRTDKTIPMVLVGNKCDYESSVISPEDGVQLASEYKIPFFLCSAKNGQNISEVFEKLVENILLVEHDNEKKLTNHVQKLKIGDSELKHFCC